MINKDKVKNTLTIDEVTQIVNSFGGDAAISKFGLICRTICHNHPKDNPSRKLYYYENTRLFKCFTECDETFDIFELIIKCFKIQNNEEIELPTAIGYLLNKLGKSSFSYVNKYVHNDEDLLETFIAANMDYSFDNEKKELIEYDNNLIKNLHCLRILDWEKEDISYETLKKYNIRYYVPTAQIVIPHYDINNRLVGIRGRTLIEEDAQRYGKYMPLIASGKMYNHPLGFNLYGLNINKDNIEQLKIAIIVEGEKSVLKAENYLDKNVCVAACGSTIQDFQINELLSLGVREIVIAFDRQYKEYGDDECRKWHDKINKIVCKYKDYAIISVIFDEHHLLGYKDSPLDCGKEVFFELFKNRKVAE